VPGRLPVLTFGLAGMVGAATLAAMRREARAGRARRRRLGGELVHLGVAVAAVGLTASASYSTAHEARVPPGGAVTVSGARVQLEGISKTRDARWDSTSAALRLSGRGGDDRAVTRLRFSPAQSMTVSQPAIRNHWWGDVYVTLLDAAPDGSATLRVAVNPLIGLLWGAGALLVIGAGLAAVPGVGQRPDATPAPVPARRPEQVPV
jgi:cytochrome c-type biogenesis protein CcmF